jgi:hypothetical protein
MLITSSSVLGKIPQIHYVRLTVAGLVTRGKIDKTTGMP